MSTYEIFAELLKERKLKVSDVTRATGIAASSLTDWKKGRTATPKAETMQKLADFFGVSIEYLLGVQTSGQKGYYTDPETAEAAQEMFENTELRALFDVARDMSADDLRAIYSVAIALKRKEQGYD